MRFNHFTEDKSLVKFSDTLYFHGERTMKPTECHNKILNKINVNFSQD